MTDKTITSSRAFAIKPGHLKQIRTLAALGRREGGIARHIGTSAAGWTRLKARDPRVVEAFERGRDEFEAGLLDTLSNPTLDTTLSVQQAIAIMNRRATNAMFMAKAVLGWRDGGDAPGAAVAAVQVNITASLDADGYAAFVAGKKAKVIDAE